MQALRNEGVYIERTSKRQNPSQINRFIISTVYLEGAYHTHLLREFCLYLPINTMMFENKQ